MHRSALRVAAVGTVLGALALAAPAGAKTLHGTVVHKNKSQHTFVVAGRGGKLTVVSARKSPAVSRKVAVKVRRAHGANVARGIRAQGTARTAVLHGTVTFSDASSFAISAGGTSIVVQMSGATPPVGTVVTVTITFGNDDELDTENVDEHGDNNGTVKIEGAIQAIDPTARTLSVFADDNEENDDDNAGTTPPTVTVHVPASFDLTQFHVGDEVELIVVPQTDGSFLLQSVDEDDNEQGDDNGKDDGQNGVQQGDDNQGEDNGGDSGSGGGDD
jgi:hypothetical protein